MNEEEFCYCHYHDDTYEYFDCLDYMECKDCPYYYGEINYCMYGEKGVPDDLEKKCNNEK